MPYFSIVIPCYNKEDFIAETIHSVLEQDFNDYELIIVDDGSTDSSVNIINSFDDSRIKLLKKINGGVSSARNYGIKNATGKYIAFLDADDIWNLTHLSSAYELIEKNFGFGLYCLKFARLQGNKKTEANFKDIPAEDGKVYIINDYFKKSAIADNIAWTSAVIVPREVFNDNINFPEGVNRGEDRFVWGVIALENRVILMNKVTAFYRVHDTGLTSSQKMNFKWIFEEYFNSLDLENVQYRPIKHIKMYIQSRKINVLRFHIREKQYLTATKMIFLSLKYRELYWKVLYNILQSFRWGLKDE